MKKRKGFLGEDYCFEDYCLTKCEKYPSIYIGSCDCHKCKNFISEFEEPGAVIVTCKK